MSTGTKALLGLLALGAVGVAIYLVRKSKPKRNRRRNRGEAYDYALLAEAGHGKWEHHDAPGPQASAEGFARMASAQSPRTAVRLVRYDSVGRSRFMGEWRDGRRVSNGKLSQRTRFYRERMAKPVVAWISQYKRGDRVETHLQDESGEWSWVPGTVVSVQTGKLGVRVASGEVVWWGGVTGRFGVRRVSNGKRANGTSLSTYLVAVAARGTGITSVLFRGRNVAYAERTGETVSENRWIARGVEDPGIVAFGRTRRDAINGLLPQLGIRERV